MRLLHWHHAFDHCTSLDELRSCWHEVAQRHHLHPGAATAQYHDALLSFIATSPLPAPMKLGGLLTCVSDADFDLRLALGALDAGLQASAVDWPAAFVGEAPPGPCVALASRDAQVTGFALERLAGLHKALRQDGKRPAHWASAFWHAYLALACRWADIDALELALDHGARIEQAGPAAMRVLAEGVHAHTDDAPYYNQGRRHLDYLVVLDRLRAAGFDLASYSAVMLCAAAAVDNTDMLDSLVDRGADLAVLGAQALTAAASSEAHGAAEWLLAHGVDVHGDADAALVAAVAALDETMVETLLAAGADVHAGGELPLRTAFLTRPADLYKGETDFIDQRADLVALLLQYGADPGQPAVVIALRKAVDGAAVVEEVLDRNNLDALHQRALNATAKAAFG